MYKRIVIFGDEFGIPILLDVIPPKKIIGVVVASNRPQNHIFIQQMAENIGVSFFIQPPYLSKEYFTFYNNLNNIQPDSIFCNSYSMLLKEDILQLVSFHAFNVHASYLPYNRGPNPIQWAIIHGHEYTGVTIHCMDTSFDTGNIIYQQKISIPFESTWVSLKELISSLVVELCHCTIPEMLKGNYTSHKQNEIISNTNYRLTSDSPRIDFTSMSDIEVYNLIRSQVKPLNGAYTIIDGERQYFDEFIPFNAISQLREIYHY